MHLPDRLGQKRISLPCPSFFSGQRSERRSAQALGHAASLFQRVSPVPENRGALDIVQVNLQRIDSGSARDCDPWLAGAGRDMNVMALESMPSHRVKARVEDILQARGHCQESGNAQTLRVSGADRRTPACRRRLARARMWRVSSGISLASFT